jgi:hypothetical protein
VSRKKRPGPTPRRRTVAAPPPTAGLPPAHGEDHDHSASLWVSSEPTPTGVYVATVHLGDRVLAVLDRDAALRWTAAVTQVVAYARYDASLYAQLHNIFKGDMNHIGYFMTQLRKDRPPAPAADTAPLLIEPIVSHRDRKPRVKFDDGRGQTGTLEASQAEQHAMHVLEVSITVDIDAAYVRMLKSSIELPDPEARGMVGMLARWRVE